MRKNPFKSLGTLAIISIVLFLGGVLFLQNINYKASETDASLYFSESVKPASGTFSIGLKAHLSKDSQISGLQAGLLINKESIAYVDFVPATGLKLLKAEQDDDEIFVALVSDGSNILMPAGELNIGDLYLKTINDSNTKISFDSHQTLLTIFDGTQDPSIYNAPLSFQNIDITTGNITLNAIPTQTSSIKNTLDNSQSNLNYNNQRIVSSDVLTYPENAAILLTLQKPALSEIEYGLTEDLPSKVESKQSTDKIALEIMNLQENTRYYYRINLIDKNNSKIIGNLQSFKTTISTSTGTADPRMSYLKVFPEESSYQKGSEVFLVLRDKDDQTITGLKPSIEVIKGDAKVNISESNGFYFGEIESSSQSNQTITVQTKIGDIIIGQDDVIFKTQPTEVETSSNSNSTLYFILACLSLIALLSTIAYWRAIRIK